MLTDGDLVRTLNGRAEIVFAEGSLLHLDYGTELEVLSPVRLRLLNGRVSFRTSPSGAQYVLDTSAASLRLEPRGEYGVTSDGRQARLELTVARGSAEVDDGSARTLVRGGEMASILGAGGRVLLQQFNSARWDAFERWSNDRANGFSSAASARDLPYELRPYGGVFDSHGRWDYVAPYGNVWFPTVTAGWRPYYTGSWKRTRYGWTWIGVDPWAWPTHHFGRWGFTGVSWYWIPARVWGPAWVSWSFSPGFVSWCPLGFDGRAVIGYSHVSSWLRGGRDHPDYRPHYDPWRAWTIMPRDQFDTRRPVRTHAIDPTQLPDETRRAMANTAVPRESVGPPLPPSLARIPSELPRTSPAADVRVPAAGFPDPRGAVRSPNAIRTSPFARGNPERATADRPAASPRPEPGASSGETSPSAPASPERPEVQRRDDPSTRGAIYYPPRVYDRGSAVERRGDTRPDDRADRPRTYTPPTYAVPRTERPARSERAETPSPSARPDNPTRYGGTSPERPETRGREGGPPPAARRGDESSGSGNRNGTPSQRGGSVRSPGGSQRESGGEGRAQPRSGGNNGSSGSSSGGAVRRRP